jgi:hypothetical protein
MVSRAKFNFAPGLKLFLLVKIVISIEPVVIFLLPLVPDIVVPSKEQPHWRRETGINPSVEL